MWNKVKIMRLAERALKRTQPYLENRSDSDDPQENFQLMYVLFISNKSQLETAIAFAHRYDEFISFDPLDSSGKVKEVWNWAYNFENDLFRYLDHGYELAGMSLETHCAAWSEIDENISDGAEEYPKGMQLYLDYCKKNRITVERLRSEGGYEGMDVMTLYDKSAVREKQSQNHER